MLILTKSALSLGKSLFRLHGLSSWTYIITLSNSIWVLKYHLLYPDKSENVRPLSDFVVDHTLIQAFPCVVAIHPHLGLFCCTAAKESPPHQYLAVNGIEACAIWRSLWRRDEVSFEQIDYTSLNDVIICKNIQHETYFKTSKQQHQCQLYYTSRVSQVYTYAARCVHFVCHRNDLHCVRCIGRTLNSTHSLTVVFLLYWKKNVWGLVFWRRTMYRNVQPTEKAENKYSQICKLTSRVPPWARVGRLLRYTGVPSG